MSKNTIVLADNSYTIRRIVELSFAEEEGIELISFENGLNLKDKLLEIKPAIVLADIKLPEMNGYDICKFINDSKDLNETRVFLMKGGFEPIDENLLKELKYIDIITKPFDSNALVNRLRDLLEKPVPDAKPAVEDMPSTLPEDMPEIEGFSETGDEINFSDVKDEVDSDAAVPRADETGTDDIPREDVQPSEEKTQDSQFEKEDKLRFDNIEEIENPFKDDQSSPESSDEDLSDEEEQIKQNIRAQEKELEIDSLTQEEINIKKIIEQQEKDVQVDEEEEAKDDTADQMEDSLEAEVASELEAKSALDTEDSGSAEAVGSSDSEISSKPDDLLSFGEPSAPGEKEESVEIDLGTGEPEATERLDLDISEREEPVSAPSDPETSPEHLGIDFPASMGKEAIMEKVEGTLTTAIKEILWEIIPPLAEKTIKEEIQKIKSDIDNAKE